MIQAGRRSPAQSRAVTGVSPVAHSFTLKYSQNGDWIEQIEELQTERLEFSSQMCHLAAAGVVTVVSLCLAQLCCLTQPGRSATQTEPQEGIWQLHVSFHDKPFITAVVLNAEHPSMKTECLELGPPKPAWPSLPVTHGCLSAAKQGGVVCFKDQSSFKCVASPCLHLISRQDALA